MDNVVLASGPLRVASDGCPVRGAPGCTQRLIIEAVDPCGDALVIWIFAELAFYLISYTATLHCAGSSATVSFLWGRCA